MSRLPRVRAGLSVGGELRPRPRGGPRAADGAPRRVAAGARGARGADQRGRVTRRVRHGAACEGDGNPTATGGMGTSAIRDGDVGGDAATAARETRNAEHTG